MKYFLPAVVVFFLVFIATTSFLSSPSSTPSSLPKSYSSPTPMPQTNDVHSSDGTHKITMRTVKNTDGSLMYTFYVSDVLGAQQKYLFEKTTLPLETMSIPANSWSPDNTYVFLIDELNGAKNAFVFKSSGEEFSGSKRYLDLGSTFAKRQLDYTISDITGWDSPTLLHVYSVKGADKGPAFWFDVPSDSFIQLAR